MHRTRFGSLLLGVGLVLLASCSTTAQRTADALFQLQPAQGRQALAQTPDAHPYLRTLLDDPASVDIRLVDVDPQQVSSERKTLSVALPDGRTVRFQLLRVNDAQPGMLGWIGDVASHRRQPSDGPAATGMDPLNWISLMREGAQVTGDIHVDGQTWRLTPVGASQHALVKVDEAKRPPEAPPLVAEPDSVTAQATAARAASSTIRLLFVTTEQSRAAYPNYRLLLAQLLQNANLHMANSQVAITFELAGYEDAPYDETGKNYNVQLTELRDPDSELGRAVLMTRDAWRADLVTMFITAPEYCGLAFVNATKSSGYSAFSCTGGTLSHELGHNLGLNHVWNPGDPVPSPPYRNGYQRKEPPAFHTLMVSSHGAVPYFSNPRLNYQGVPMGTVEYNDAARRLEERRETVENFYPPPLTFKLYEHENFEGRSCEIVHPRPGLDMLVVACGSEWGAMVSSVRILGITPNTTVTLADDGTLGTYYQSVQFTGQIDLPQLHTFIPVPGTRGAGAVGNDRVYAVKSEGQ